MFTVVLFNSFFNEEVSITFDSLAEAREYWCETIEACDFNGYIIDNTTNMIVYFVCVNIFHCLNLSSLSRFIKAAF